MAGQVKAVVIAGNGTNCEREVAFACRLAGAEVADIVHIAEFLAGRVRLEDYHFLNLAGGFLDGDDLGSAKAGANRLLHAPVAGGPSMAEQIRRFVEDGKLIMGVCNGFQLMVKMGLLPALDGNLMQQSATLTFNDSGRFEDRWTYLAVDGASPCVYTRGLDGLYLPVRHGEGKFVPASDEVLARIEAEHLAPLRYADEQLRPTMDYPLNPNGSTRAIAGVCDPTGRLFGLMPHPEAYLHRTHHPRWTREEDLPEEGMGLWLYRNAVQFIRENIL
ncbi:phosphoribosylformylglycinamidine synthase subunit I [Geothermobacter ehrlichii]|uniref:Phosphoribosylformylglycinamidine synthase subunit I n=1 Tax=Geothermobacter ehrlichii TaxID=213224 RepID=A0A5D3WL34_9BACT|nr:phosphoribosylformylglycinamidine synthase subunit PurQ [Geothermobacter ehrlichii]TYO99737.1 phosphoribosylformylglycinamidine synthase subunit I [Geothermobacter ehrlichii]